jgi:hypothetical protein
VSVLFPLASAALAALLVAAPAAPGRDNVVGEAASVVPAEHKVVVNKDGGGQVAVTFDDKTALLRALPGAKTLEGATPVQPQEIAAGDRLLCRGTLDAAGGALAANRIVVMARGDVEARRKKEQEDWQKRGIAGVVSAVDPAAKEFSVRSGAGPTAKTLVVETGGAGVGFRRYAPTSVRFSDAKPGTFTDLAVGDQVRVLGNRSADGGRVTAEQVVSGAFKVVRGVVAEVDAAKGTVSVREGEKAIVTVAVSPETLMRRLPPMMVMRLLRGSEGGNAQGPGGGAPGGPGAGAPGAPPAAAMAPGGPGAGGPGSGAPGGAPGGGWAGRQPDPDEALERLPATTLAELVKGEEIAVLGPKQAGAAALPAIKLAVWTMPAFPAGAGNGNTRGGRGQGMGGGGADAFSDMLGFGGENPF